MMQTSEKKPLTAAQQHQQAKKRRALLRAALQVFFFFSMPGAFVAGFNGVKLLFQRIGAGEVLQADSFTLSLLGLCGFTLLFGRFFCGYVCAFGGLGDAVYALSSLIQKKLFHRRAPFRLPERNAENCIPGCSACARRCPVGLKPDAASLRSGECIGCEACVDTCPRGNLSRPALDPARHFVLSALVRSALFFGMGVCLGFCRF